MPQSRCRREEAAALFAQFVKNGTSLTPTLVAYRSTSEAADFAADPRDKYISASAKAITAKLIEKYKDSLTPEVVAARKRIFAEFLGLVGLMNRAGVNLMAGTDVAAGRIYPGFSLHDELGVPASSNPERGCTINRSSLVRPLRGRPSGMNPDPGLQKGQPGATQMAALRAACLDAKGAWLGDFSQSAGGAKQIPSVLMASTGGGGCAGPAMQEFLKAYGHRAARVRFLLPALAGKAAQRSGSSGPG